MIRPCSLSVSAGAATKPYFIRWDPRPGVYGEDWLENPPDSSHHPIAISQYALYLHERWYAERDEGTRDAFLNHAVWLRDNQESHPMPGVYRFGGPVSAVAQGEAISVLLRADAIAPRRGFMEAASRAAQPFRHDVGTGGVVWRNGANAFFEEAANVNAAHVLSGCVFALWGLWELWVVAPEAWQGELIERCAATIKRWLPLYDTGWWTLHSLARTPAGRSQLASLKYHAYHIAQMKILGSIFGEAEFSNAAERWTSYIDGRSSRGRLLADAMISSLAPR